MTPATRGARARRRDATPPSQRDLLRAHETRARGAGADTARKVSAANRARGAPGARVPVRPPHEVRRDHLRSKGPRPPPARQGPASPARAHPPRSRPTAVRLRLRFVIAAAVRGARATAYLRPEHGEARARARLSSATARSRPATAALDPPGRLREHRGCARERCGRSDHGAEGPFKPATVYGPSSPLRPGLGSRRPIVTAHTRSCGSGLAFRGRRRCSRRFGSTRERCSGFRGTSPRCPRFRRRSRHRRRTRG